MLGRRSQGVLATDKNCLAWCMAAQRCSPFSLTSPALLLSSPPTELKAVSTKSSPSLYPTKSPACSAKFLHVHLPVSALLWVFCLPPGVLAGSAFWERTKTSEEREGMAGHGQFSTVWEARIVVWALLVIQMGRSRLLLTRWVLRVRKAAPASQSCERLCLWWLKYLQDLREDLVFTCLHVCICVGVGFVYIIRRSCRWKQPSWVSKAWFRAH